MSLCPFKDGLLYVQSLEKEMIEASFEVLFGIRGLKFKIDCRLMDRTMICELLVRAANSERG